MQGIFLILHMEHTALHSVQSKLPSIEIYSHVFSL